MFGVLGKLGDMSRRLGAVFCSVVLAATFANGLYAQEPADVVFKDAKIYTVNKNKPWAEALAISDNKIVFVGNEGDVAAWIGKKTKIIDLNDKMIVPGFISGHENDCTNKG